MAVDEGLHGVAAWDARVRRVPAQLTGGGEAAVTGAFSLCDPCTAYGSGGLQLSTAPYQRRTWALPRQGGGLAGRSAQQTQRRRGCWSARSHELQGAPKCGI